MGVVARLGRELAAELLPRAMQANADGAGRRSEHGSHFLAREIVDVVQEHRVTLCRRQHLDGFANALEELRRLRRRRGVADRCAEHPPVERSAAKPHLRDVDRDPAQPAFEPQGIAELGKREERTQHRFLHDVLGLVADQPRCDRDHARPRRDHLVREMRPHVR